MSIREFFTHDVSFAERVLITLIAVMAFVMFLPDDDEPDIAEVVIPDSTFFEYPLVAWASTKRGGMVSWGISLRSSTKFLEEILSFGFIM